jgi:membrane-bound lytic murein transglycosylase MltF
LPSVASLISQVSDGTIGYAIVGSIAASLARNIYLDFDVAFTAGGKREIAWAVPTRYNDLRKDLDAFIALLRRDGTLARLTERYMPDPRQIQRMDAGMLRDKIRTVLPQY